MVHFKCLVCTMRLCSTDSEAVPIGDLCAVCGSLLEPIGELDGIVAVQAVRSRAPGRATKP